MTPLKLIDTINMVHMLRDIVDPRATLNKIVIFLTIIRDEHVTLKELERQLDIERSVVNKNLTALIESNLIVLTTEPIDMRKKRVHLTLKGTALAHRLFMITTTEV